MIFKVICPNAIMRLKKLEISGFKSFAKPTVLEFPSKITAIVGPNGSGKSNIVEAIRWVLGEQSMKSLRGKRGEDLIYNGSPQSPRMGKASVELLFNNKDHWMPLDFDEAMIARKIFRDGLNEYFINNSQVRLKDVVELLAKIGLGEAKHNIISQGEVDRMLLSTSRDRKEMLEEALGLRIYQLKKREAERKLDGTEENIKQVESLIREISPHLKFLKAQAEKAEARGSIEFELKNLQKIYFTTEFNLIKSDKERLEKEQKPLEETLLKVSKLIEETSRAVAEEEKKLENQKSFTEEEKALFGLEAKRRELERELGRLEGRLEMERQKIEEPRVRLVDASYIQEKISDFIKDIENILEEGDRVDFFRENLRLLCQDLEELKLQIGKGRIEEGTKDKPQPLIGELENSFSRLQAELKDLSSKVESKQGILRLQEHSFREAQSKIRNLERILREREEEKRDVELRLQRFDFEREKLLIRDDDLKRDISEAGFDGNNFFAGNIDGYDGADPQELKKKTERLKGKLEEIGGIDLEVVKEYKETESRYEFLSKEVADLKRASVSLQSLIKELEHHIENDFKIGFAKIKEEFNNYFRIIFGGGSAKLRVVTEKTSKIPDDTEEELMEEIEEGIEIDVDLPRKRIKGLSMLSGGERALTAIALLFAITAVNPPPFLVLDETDAALDEANSRKYAYILKELAQKTQLILVTHNRETMVSAGILYGVTMGDDGISKLLSIKLEEAEVYTSR